MAVGVMEPVSLFKKEYVVGLSDVDFTKTLKVGTLFGYFQDVASLAVENLGIGINTLEEKFSVAWVLIKIRVDIERLPVWNEKIILETWPQTPKRLEFNRDYMVRDADGNVLARAVSTWVIIDIKTRELQQTELIAVDYPEFITERALDCRLGKLKPYGRLEVAYKKIIGYSDVDFYGHLNNSKYIDYIMDCFTVEQHRKYRVGSIEIDYINEALPGDTLALYRDISALDSDMIYIEGVNEKDGNAAFKTRVRICER